MKLILYNGCKTLAVIIVLLVVIVYYYDMVFNSVVNFPQHLIGTEATETLKRNTTNCVETSLKRIKRFLIFEGGGVVKLVFGTSFPILLPDKKRSLNYFYNFQMQYVPPPKPLYWWSFFNTTTFASRRNLRRRSVGKRMQYDKSRTLIYEVMEKLLERTGNNGKECILKIICELARAPLAEDVSASRDGDNDDNSIGDNYGRYIYHKLVNAIFTPPFSNVDERYLNARIAGQNGANCNDTFGECPIIEMWFKRFTRFL